MRKDWELTRQVFDDLLAWLDPDREAAALKYENIRLRLIRFFSCRACSDPEELTDETMNRVASKVAQIRESYSGNPFLYFYGVADNVVKEQFRKVPPAPPEPSTPTDDLETTYECLESCMGELPQASRVLVLVYYTGEKRAKINNRKQQATELGITLDALRIRAHRIRKQLQLCVAKCLQNEAGS